MKVSKKILSALLCFVLIVQFFVFNVDFAKASSGYNWRVTVYVEDGSSLFQDAYIDLNYIFTDGSGITGKIRISSGKGEGTPWQNENDRYYSFVSNSSLSANGIMLASGFSLPVNTMPISVDAYCSLSGNFFTTPNAKWKVMLEVFDNNNKLIGDFTYGENTSISSVAGAFISGTATDELNYEYYKEYCVYRKVPSEYDFYNDSYSFENYSSTIPYGYFKTMYGAAKGWKLWKHQRNQGGLCFGFSYTTAAYFNNLPNIASVRSLSLADLLSIGNNNLTVETYIKYAHIYQMSMEFSGNSHWSTAQEIYNIVKNCAEDDNIMCTIGMTHSSQGGHRVLAVGVEGNDILIDDPNNRVGYERLTVNSDGTWSFSGLNGWGSSNCRIRYSLDISAPFKFIKTLKPLTVNNAFIDNSSIDEIASNCESEVLSKDYLLLSVDSDEYTISNSDIEVIETEYELPVTNENLPEMYWLGTDKTINFEELSENSEISLSGNTKSVELFASDSCSASLTVDEEQSEISALVNSKMDEEYEITVNDFDDNNIKTMTISGYANDDEVSLKEINNSITVSGLNEVTVKYETDKETLETEIRVNDGSTINITVNEEKNVIETDWICKHINENEDDICDNCGAVVKEEISENKCSHFCHSSNSFLQLVWKIINFFAMIFGIEAICSCGAAHY